MGRYPAARITLEFVQFIEDVYHTLMCRWNHHVFVQTVRDDIQWCVHCGISPDDANR